MNRPRPAASLPTRRGFLAASAGAALAPLGARAADDPHAGKALVAVTLDLEMSAHYPRRGITEWNYRKGDLDEATKDYAVEAAKLVRAAGGVVHFFCVGRVLEQENVDWLKAIAAADHPVGNHTYDHVNVKAATPEEAQFRFTRAPWLVKGKTAAEVIRENVRMTTAALKERVGIVASGFRTPGGFADGLRDRPDVRRMLREEGFSWVSSLYPAHPMGKPKEGPTAAVLEGIVLAQEKAQPFAYPDGLIEVPMSPVSDVNAFRTHYWKLDWFLGAIEKAVAWAVEKRTVFDFLAHPSCLVVEDPKLESIKLICGLVKRAGERAALMDLNAIARRVKGMQAPAR